MRKISTKRILSMVLAMVMTISLLPVQVYADVYSPDDPDETVETATGTVAGGKLDVEIKWLSGDGSGTVSDGTVVATTTGGTVYQCIAKVTLTNTGTEAIGLTFAYNADTYSSFTIDGTPVGQNATVCEGTHSATLAGKASLVLSITGTDGGPNYIETATLTLSDFKVTQASQSGVQFLYDSTMGSVTVDGKAVASGESVELSASTLVATPKDSSVSFLGWVDADTGLLVNATAPFTPTGQKRLTAAFASSTYEPWFYANNKRSLYKGLDAAIASGYKTLILAADGTLQKKVEANGDTLPYNIPSGVSLVIPYDANDTGTFGTEPDPSTSPPGSSRAAFRTLKLADGTIINCSGTLNVNGCIYEERGNQTGACTDDYGCIDMGEDAQINMNSGSKLYCYGYIIGDGTVTANTGAETYEVFQMTGWKGGSAALAWSDRETLKSFAFNDYAVQNIEADYIVSSGATASVVAAVTVMGMLWNITRYAEAPFIGGTGLVRLGSGASVHRSYTPNTNRMKYTLHGTASLDAISLTVNGIPLNSASYILAIPTYMDFVAAPGSKVTLKNNYKLLPGASLTVESGAYATVDGNLYIYDVKDYAGQGYVSGNSIPVRYVASTGKTYSSLPRMSTSSPSGQVNVEAGGILEVTSKGGIFTTVDGGTSVDKVLKGGGTFINNSGKTADDIGLDEYTYSDGIQEYGIAVTPVVGQIAGVSVGNEYHSFASGTYYGLGDGYWYNHAVSTDAFGNIKNIKNISEAAVAGIPRSREVQQFAALGSKTTIPNVIGFVSDYWDGSKIVTTPFRFNTVSGVSVVNNNAQTSTLTGSGIGPYELSIASGNVVLTAGVPANGNGKIFMRYDDRYDLRGSVVDEAASDWGTPTSYQVGYGIEENATLDAAVVTLEGNTLIATGIGTATVVIDGVSTTVTVTPAPISLMLIGGQSNAQGSWGVPEESIICPDGQVYATYGERYAMTVNNATNFVASTLAGAMKDVNINGTTENLLYGTATEDPLGYPIWCLTEEGNGKKGLDSGLAYEWVRNSGEKIWVVNAAHGGTSLSVWQKGAKEYKEAVKLFGACQEVLRKEIAAGHYTLSHMGMYWCQGEADHAKTTDWYTEKFLAMYENLKVDLSADLDSNAETPDNTFEFINIILPVSGTDYYAYNHTQLKMTGPRTAQWWMAANPELPEINMVSNIGDSWSVVNGEDGVEEYFQSHYENGRIDYLPQAYDANTLEDSWYTPTTYADVKPDIHYRQRGYNEVGREAGRNTMYLLGYAQDPMDVDTTVTFYDQTGYKEVSTLQAPNLVNSSALVVPVVYPVYRAKDVAYTVSDGLVYDHYSLSADNSLVSGSLTAVGANKNAVNVTSRALTSYRWELEGTQLVSNGENANELEKISGSMDDNGMFVKHFYELTEPFTLKHDQAWMLEWKMEGTWANLTKLFSETGVYNTEGTIDISVASNGYIAFTEVIGNNRRYGLDLDDYKINISEPHVYRLVNRIGNDGKNMVYLYVDGQEVGPMNTLMYANEDKETVIDPDNNWISGKDVKISFLGTKTNYYINGGLIHYIAVQEANATMETCFHDWGQWQVAQEPTLDAAGLRKRICNLCGEETQESFTYKRYHWVLEGETFKSTGANANTATKVIGSVTNGEFVGAEYKFETPIELNYNADWALEWSMSGDWVTTSNTTLKKLFSTDGVYTAGISAPALILSPEADWLMFGYYDDSHTYCGVKLGEKGIKVSDPHTYRIVNYYDEATDTREIWLFVDNVKVAQMNRYFDKNGDIADPVQWMEKKNLSFGYLGVNQNYFLNGGIIHYIDAREKGALSACVHLWGAWEIVTEATKETTGVKRHICAVCNQEETAEIPVLPLHTIYHWELTEESKKANKLESTGPYSNEMTVKAGSITDGLFSKAYYALEKPITLKHDADWSLEWTVKGDWSVTDSNNTSSIKKVFSEVAVNNGGVDDPCVIMNMSARKVMFGYYGKNAKNEDTHLYIGAKLPDDIDLTDGELHKLRLVNYYDAQTDTNEVWLFVNNTKIAAMNTASDGKGTDPVVTTDWVNGRDFSFGYVGTQKKYWLDNGIITDIFVMETGASTACDHTWGNWQIVTEATLTATGERRRVCSLCGEDEYQVIPVLTKDVTYHWVLTEESEKANKLESTGPYLNEMTIKAGSITGGLFKKAYYQLEKAIELKYNKDWSLEWTMRGTWTDGTTATIFKPFSTDGVFNAGVGAPAVIFAPSSNRIMFGYYSSGHKYAGVQLPDRIDLDDGNEHTFRLVNYYDEATDTREVWLFADNEKIAPMTNTLSTTNTSVAWMEKKNFSFKYLGAAINSSNDNYYLHGGIITDIYVMESGASEACDHTWGDWEVVTAPTEETVGEQKRVCSACGEVEFAEIPVLESQVHYRWDLVGSEFVSSEDTENDVTKKHGSVSNGQFSEAHYALAKPVTLLHNKQWAVEWKMSGAWSKPALVKMMTESSGAASEVSSLMIAKSGRVTLGRYGTISGVTSNKTHIHYGVDLDDYGIDYKTEHTYRLVNEIDETTGDNMVWLYVDNEKIAAMNTRYIAADKVIIGQSAALSGQDWVNGKDFEFDFLGTSSSYWLDGGIIDYIEVWESNAPEVDEIPNATYRWYLDAEGGLESTGKVDNPMIARKGTTENGLFQATRFQMQTPIVLEPNKDWIVEWEMDGTWLNDKGVGRIKLLSDDGIYNTTDGRALMMDTEARRLYLCYYTGKTHMYYGVDLAEYQINMQEEHRYRLVNRIDDETGKNMVWLYVDGEEIAAMNMHFPTSTSGTVKGESDWVSGKTFTFGYMGVDQSYALNNGIINYIIVQESSEDHVHDYQTEGTDPTCTEQGYTTYTCTCGDSYVDDYVDALGHYYENGVCVRCGKTPSDTSGGGSGEPPVELPDIAQIIGDRAYSSLQEAIDNYTGTGYIQMLGNADNVAVELDEQNVMLDLSGFDLSLASLAASETLYVIDTSTDGYGSENIGSITVSKAVADRLALLTKYEAKGVSTKYYVLVEPSVNTLAEEDTVTYTANRVAVSVTGMQFAFDSTNVKGYLTYRGTFRGNENTASVLTDFGFQFDSGDVNWYRGEGDDEVTADDLKTGSLNFFYTEELSRPSTVDTIAAWMKIREGAQQGTVHEGIQEILSGLKGKLLETPNLTNVQREAINKFFGIEG